MQRINIPWDFERLTNGTNYDHPSIFEKKVHNISTPLQRETRPCFYQDFEPWYR